MSKRLFENLNSQELQQLKGYSPELVSTIKNTAASLRKGGRQITLPDIVKQIGQLYPNNPEINKFLGANTDLTAGLKNVGAQPKSNVVAPPQDFTQQAQQQYQQTIGRQTPVPQQPKGGAPGIAPPPAWLTQGQKDIGIDVKPVSPQHYNNLSQTAQQLDAIEAQKAQQQPQASNKQGRAAALQTRRTPQQVQLSQKIGKLPTMNVKKESKENLQELNMTMLGSSIKGIISAISKLKPEELIAIAGFVNNMIAGAKGGPGAVSSSTSMSSTTYGENNMKEKYAKVLKENLKEQVKVKMLSEHYLNEGPLSNAWENIKSAGSSMMNRLTGGDKPDPTAGAGVDEQTKKVAQELSKLVGKVNQTRQKFNASILKNSEAVSHYHDLVLSLWQMYNQNAQMLGPHGQQISRQVNDAVGNFQYDLNSEKEQIDTFLKSLKGNKKTGVPDATSLGASAKASAQERRAAEADASQRLGSSGLHGVKQGGGSRAADSVEYYNKEALKNKIATATNPQEKAQAVRDLEALFLKSAKRTSSGKEVKPAKKPAKKSTKSKKK